MAKIGFMETLAVAATASPKNSIAGWLGKTVTPSDGGFWSSFFSSKDVSIDKALQVSTVWACVRLISETIATLPLSMYQRKADGGRESAKALPLYSILHDSPNIDMTSVSFWEAFVASLLFRGNAYCEIKRNVLGHIMAIYLLMPDRCRRDPATGRFYYRESNGSEREIPKSKLWHTPAFSLDGINGLSPIRYGALVIGSALSADTAAHNTFENGLMPTVAFSVDRTLNKEQRAEFKKYTESISGAMHAGESPILEKGVTAAAIGIAPEDAQLLESRGWSVEEICRFFRVPPHMVGHTEKSTSWGTGIEQQMIGFLTFSLAPWLKRIEASVNKHLLSPAEKDTYYSEFSLEGLLRADSKSRADFYAIMIRNGLYTRDECRSKENLPQKGGNAGILTVEMNLCPLDKLGEQVEPQAKSI